MCVLEELEVYICHKAHDAFVNIMETNVSGVLSRPGTLFQILFYVLTSLASPNNPMEWENFSVLQVKENRTQKLKQIVEA